MYPLILSFEPINKLKMFFECGIPMPQDSGTPLLALMPFFLTHFRISIAVLKNVPPDAGLQKRAIFSILNVGLAGTGNRSQATCVASSGTNHSAIHYTTLAWDGVECGGPCLYTAHLTRFHTEPHNLTSCVRIRMHYSSPYLYTYY
jgi:hypothetical protein